MNKNLKKISTLDMPHEEWLRHRQRSIGGSDAAAIVGLSAYVSPYTVWADKLGKIPPSEDNEAMRQGRDLEQYVAERFAEATGKKVRRENNILINPDFPFAHANVDRIVIGEDAGLECKTTNQLNLKKFKNGEFPDHYYVQCMHYMMVTGCSKWYLAVLVLGREFLWFEIERDEEEIAALAKSEQGFWKCVEQGVPPAADGSKSTTDTIQTMFPDSSESSVSLFSFDNMLTQREDIKRSIGDLKALQDEIENKIKAYMQDASRGESDKYRVTWSTSERSSFDSKRFAADHPEMDLSKYFKTTKSRIFRVNKKGDK